MSVRWLSKTKDCFVVYDMSPEREPEARLLMHPISGCYIDRLIQELQAAKRQFNGETKRFPDPREP
jgi:hypothetical protein